MSGWEKLPDVDLGNGLVASAEHLCGMRRNIYIGKVIVSCVDGINLDKSWPEAANYWRGPHTLNKIKGRVSEQIESLAKHGDRIDSRIRELEAERDRLARFPEGTPK